VNDPAPTLDRDVCTKSEFARRRRVSAARVSQWIKERKLDGGALVGDGRAALIRESVAIELKSRLNIDQRLANGLETRLSPVAPAAPATQPAPADRGVGAPSAPVDPVPLISAADLVEEKIKQARLAGIEFDNRKKAEDEAARAGRYVLADATAQQMGRVAGQMLNIFEGWLSELASSISGKFSLPQRDVLHLLRTSSRELRVKTSASLAEEAHTVPALVEDDDASEVAEG
jgi:hypothetical protein